MRAGLGDFDADIAASAQWSAVQSQLTSEGAPKIDIDRAKDLFVNAAKGMSADMGVDTSKALDGARDLVFHGRTIAGAVSGVVGLIKAGGQNVPPMAIVQTFTGPMIAAAVSAGSISAGVGAAIVVGVALVFSALESLHLLGQPVAPAPRYNVCGNESTWKPSWIVGCQPIYGLSPPAPGSVISPNSSKWLRFPDPLSNEDWSPGTTYVNGLNATVNRTNASWYLRSHWNGGVVTKAAPVELAFPQFTRMMRDLPPFVVPAPPEAKDDPTGHVYSKANFSWPPAVLEFYKAFFAAWRANAEFSLNGLQGRPDWQVLRHLLLIWNRAHAPGTPVTIEARPNDLPDPNDQNSVNYNAAFDREVAGNGVPYLSILVDDLARFSPDDAPGGAIQIHTGPRKNVGVVRDIGGLVGNVVEEKSATSTSTGTKWFFGTLVVAGLTAGGVWVYSRRSHQSYVGAWKTIGRAAKKPFSGR
jgi:hypothetical protein